jgi:tetratricopeptide (TPR) repeat protein
MLFHQPKMSLSRFKKTIVCVATFLALVTPPCLLEADALPGNQVGKAVALLEQRQYTDALEVLHALEKSLSDPAQISNMFAIAYLGQGYQLLARREFSAARDSFRSGRSYNEEDVRLWRGEAMTFYMQGKYSAAASLLDQAIGIDPENPRVYDLLGKAYYADGRLSEAIDALQRSLEYGGGEDVAAFLDKVRREQQIEAEMQEEYRGHFQLSFEDGEHASAVASEILETLEDAYLEVGSELAYYPDIRVPVLLYKHRDYVDVTRSPDWAGAVYDGKIRLPLAGIRAVNKQLAAILYHEYMHVMVHFMAGRNVPVWLNEGLAEIAGRRINPTPQADLTAAAVSGQLLDWQILASPFSGLADDRIALAYEQSYSLASFMVESYGWHNMRELLETLGKQLEWSVAVAEVYREYGLDWPAIQNEWQAGID